MLRSRRSRLIAAALTLLLLLGVGTAWAAVDGTTDTTGTASTLQADGLLGGGAPTSAVPDVQAAISAHFALFRDQPATGMPADAVAQVGSPGRYGRNPDLAREIETPTGPGWVIPGNGYLCIAVPDPVDGYGTTCLPTDVAAQQGLSIRLWGDLPSGKTAETMLVPDGASAVVSEPGAAAVAVPADGGVADALTDHPGALQLAP